MSIVAAVKKGKQVVIGADSQYNFGSGKACNNNIKSSKIRRIGSVYLSSTGWGLYDDILDDYLSTKKTVKLTSKLDIFRFFNLFWKSLHKNYPFVNDQSDDDASPFGDLDANFLIITKKSIFHVSSNLSVTEFLKFQAIGSGCDYALGAMHAVYDMEISAEDIARKAIQASIEHDVYCGGEIELITI